MQKKSFPRRSTKFKKPSSFKKRPYNRNYSRNNRSVSSFDPLAKEFPRNENIRANEVRVVSADEGNLGVMPVREALERAKEYELDLVMIASQANPPVCKIVDWKSFRYQHMKKEKERKKGSKSSKMKEIKMSAKIAGGDLQRKIDKVLEIIGKGDQVKITIMKKWPVTIEGTRAFKDDLLTKLDGSCNIISVQQKGRNIYVLVKALGEKDGKKEKK